ncbi:MAG TPA: hypothetical protein VF101_01995 [Gaiellaceae bacterium]
MAVVRNAIRVLLGAGAAAAAIGLGVESRSPRPVPLARFVSRISPAENKVRLTDAELASYRRWAERVRACMAKAGTRVGAPTVGSDEILIALSPAQRVRASKAGFRCAAAAGGPPEHSSFVFEHDGKIHVYRPRACLLPVVPAKS